MVLEREGWVKNKPLGFEARPARASGPLLQAMAGTFAVVGGICLHQGCMPVKPSRGKTESAHLLFWESSPAASLARRES